MWSLSHHDNTLDTSRLMMKCTFLFGEDSLTLPGFLSYLSWQFTWKEEKPQLTGPQLDHSNAAMVNVIKDNCAFLAMTLTVHATLQRAGSAAGWGCGDTVYAQRKSDLALWLCAELKWKIRLQMKTSASFTLQLSATGRFVGLTTHL